MLEKCAIYVRVSSDRQDYERQIADLYSFAKDNNLKIPDDALFEDKLSGFTDENEREGLRKLLDYVAKNQITRILVWELSRLARKQVNLLRLVEDFEKDGINVRFIKQGFWTLDESLRISLYARMAISLIASFDEYEVILKKDRFASAKRLNEKLGKYNGGKILFGYKLDDENRYTINDDKLLGLQVSESDIVREVFNLYESGLVCSKICRICRSKGYPKTVCVTHTLARLLRNTSYIGYKDVKLGRRPTPPIISKSQFKVVQDLIDKNKTKADKGKKHIYLLRGILKCSVCGGYVVGKQTDDAYICAKNSGSNKTNKGTSCAGLNISVSNIDGILWNRVKELMVHFQADGFDDIVSEKQAVISDLQDQINRYRNSIERNDLQRKKVNLMFRDDGYTKEEYSRAIKEIKSDTIACEKEITNLEIQVKYYEQVQSEASSLSARIENINSITDRAQMRTIIQSLVKDVTFYRVSLFKTVIYITYTWGYTRECVIYNSVQKNETVYKSLNPSHIQFNPKKGVFYFRQEPIRKKVPTSVLAELKEVKVTTTDSDDQAAIDTKQLQPAILAIPMLNESNSERLNFDEVSNIQNPNSTTIYISTYKYEKLTYFKKLKWERFSRKKKKKSVG